MVDWKEVGRELEKLSLSRTLKTCLVPSKLEEIKKYRNQGNSNFIVSKELLKRIPWSSIAPSEDALLKLIYILFLTEGPLSFYINCYCLGLILVGHHDMWSEEKQKFISSFEEIARMSLFIKLEFLERHGFKSFSKICPRKVRNAVAHYDFRIESEGTIVIEGQKLTRRESANIIHNIAEMLNLLSKNFSVG